MGQTHEFDAEQYKLSTEQQWQRTARAWYDWTSTLAEWLGPATEAMLDMARIGPGNRVLDLAAGTGEQSVRAAQRVGPRGFVLATDISSKILEFVSYLATNAGVSNIETAVMDGEDLRVEPGTFDAAISRLGLIYFPDKNKSLTSILKALQPGGWFATIGFSTPENNRFFSDPFAIVRSAAGVPTASPGQPGPFSLGSRDVMVTVLGEAGFTNTEVQLLSAPVRMASAGQCMRFEKDSFGALHQMMVNFNEEQKEAVWSDVERALEQFESGAGFEGPCELIVGAGMKPLA